MTTITVTAETIAKLEAAGFNRWTKGAMDRLYIDTTKLGLDVDYYKTHRVRSATWQGETITNADARRLLGSKVWIDVKTGELHVRTDYYNGIDESMTLESVASAYVESILAPEPETEEATEDETEPEAHTDADVARIFDSLPDWKRTEKSRYPLSFGGSHKYRVKAVTTPIFGSDRERQKRVRTYYVSSIAQLVFALNQDADYILRVHPERYDTVKGTYITAHYVERVY